MKKRILLVLFFLFFSSLCFAQTQEFTNLINKFYNAFEKGDADTLIDMYFYPEGTPDSFKEEEKQRMQAKMNQEQTLGVEWEFVKEELFNEGKNAYIEIKLTKGTRFYPETNETGSLEGVTAYAIFEKSNTVWKVLNLTNASNFDPTEKEAYAKDLKESLFGLIENYKKEKGISDEPNSIIGFIDSALFFVQAGIVIVVLLIVVFSLTGKKKQKKPSEQKVVVNVQAPEQIKPVSVAEQTSQTAQAKKDYSDAMKILRKRFASGEINKQQFEEMKKELGA